jgi:hypothetical protein
MSNTVKTTKSDEMLKSLAAQIASQSVGIFFQMKEEARHEEIIRIETVDSLMVRIEDLEQELAEKDSLLTDRNNMVADLKKKVESTSQENARMEKWWHDELCINRELRNEIEKLREKVPVEALDEMEEEKEVVNG